MLHEHIQGDHLDPSGGHRGVHPNIVAVGLLVDIEGGGDGGAGNIGVQNTHLLAPARHGHGQTGGDSALAHAALAADYGDDLLYVGIGVGRGPQVPGAAAGSAAGTIVAALF